MPCFFHYLIRLNFDHQIFNVVIIPELFVLHLLFIIDTNNNRTAQLSMNVDDISQKNVTSKVFNCSSIKT